MTLECTPAPITWPLPALYPQSAATGRMTPDPAKWKGRSRAAFPPSSLRNLRHLRRDDFPFAVALDELRETHVRLERLAAGGSLPDDADGDTGIAVDTRFHVVRFEHFVDSVADLRSSSRSSARWRPFILTYDGKPSYTVSIMEFRGDKVARETQYFADPFVAPAWRAQWVERIDA